jgi:RHS repeat-associated protein
VIPDPLGAPAGIAYVHPDHLGAAAAITDGGQDVDWELVAGPFGELEDASGSLTYNPRFPGQYADAETGTRYNLVRDYDPSLGRYLQSDPIGLLGGLDTYAYVGGNPVNYVDPEGGVWACRCLRRILFGCCGRGDNIGRRCWRDGGRRSRRSRRWLREPVCVQCGGGGCWSGGRQRRGASGRESDTGERSVL